MKINRPGRPKKTLVNSGAIKSTVIFHWNRNSDAQIIVNRGGARSSKSYSIAQLLIEWFFTISNIKILILRKTQPSLRVSCKPLIYGLIDLYGLRSQINEVKSDMNIFSPIGGMIHFGGLDDPEKIRSSEWNIIWCEEATEFDWDDYVNLKLRLSAPCPTDFRNKIFLSFNPVDENHWIRTRLMKSSEDFQEIHSMYKYNPFLSQDYINTIAALEQSDKNYFRIFSLGEWGRLEHLIYNNWVSVSSLFEGDKVYGLDFGFSNPTALVKLIIDGKKVGVEEKLYQTGLTNTALIEKLDILIPEEERNSCPIFADSAEPDRIAEINNAGFWCLPADKKSVGNSISYVASCQLNILDESDNILKEIKGYSRKTNKSGDVLEEPINFHNHTMDAMRYGIYTYYKQNTFNTPGIKTLDDGVDNYDDDDDF